MVAIYKRRYSSGCFIQNIFSKIDFKSTLAFILRKETSLGLMINSVNKQILDYLKNYEESKDINIFFLKQNSLVQPKLIILIFKMLMKRSINIFSQTLNQNLGQIMKLLKAMFTIFLEISIAVKDQTISGIRNTSSYQFLVHKLSKYLD